jgi:hypothetical protein
MAKALLRWMSPLRIMRPSATFWHGYVMSVYKEMHFKIEIFGRVWADRNGLTAVLSGTGQRLVRNQLCP